MDDPSVAARAKHRTVLDGKRVSRKRSASPSPPPPRQGRRLHVRRAGLHVAPVAAPIVTPEVVAGALAGVPVAVPRRAKPPLPQHDAAFLVTVATAVVAPDRVLIPPPSVAAAAQQLTPAGTAFLLHYYVQEVERQKIVMRELIVRRCSENMAGKFVIARYDGSDSALRALISLHLTPLQQTKNLTLDWHLHFGAAHVLSLHDFSLLLPSSNSTKCAAPSWHSSLACLHQCVLHESVQWDNAGANACETHKWQGEWHVEASMGCSC